MPAPFARNTPSPRLWVPRWVLVLAAILVVVGGSYYYAGGNVSNPWARKPIKASQIEADSQKLETLFDELKKTKVKPPDPAEKAAPAARVSAEELWQAYLTDAAGADAKYKNHWIEVNGTIARVDQGDEQRQAFVVFKTGPVKAATAVRCYFAERASASGLQVDQEIRLVGVCMGQELDVALRKCFRAK